MLLNVNYSFTSNLNMSVLYIIDNGWTTFNQASSIAIPACSCGFWRRGWIHLILPVRVLNKQERRSEVRGGEGRACLLARSSLASHPLAFCQLHCPSPSLNPLRQTGCQCGEAANMPHRTNTPTANFCSVFIYPFAACLCLKYKGQVNRWTREVL